MRLEALEASPENLGRAERLLRHASHNGCVWTGLTEGDLRAVVGWLGDLGIDKSWLQEEDPWK